MKPKRVVVDGKQVFVANIWGLEPVMRQAILLADTLWKHKGHELVITSARDGEHGPASWHYFGLAFDCRTRYFTIEQAKELEVALRNALPGFDIVNHDGVDGSGNRLSSCHIHIEYDPKPGEL